MRGKIAELVAKTARENEGWGYTRIKGALQSLGYSAGRSTFQRILQEKGIDPAPWRAHRGKIVGMDLFTVEAVTLLWSTSSMREPSGPGECSDRRESAQQG
jgi:hypothetical protein